MRAAIHPRETERIRAVEETGLLDQGVDRVQQSAVRLASEIFGVPIAAVSLVADDRQWFSARCGLDCRETTRDEAFCAHTILSEGPLVVRDATLDPRFRDNPLVTGEPGIRFYAGVPLRSREGLPLGSLCVIDRESRSPSRGQIEALKTLAGLVAAQLDMLRWHRRLEVESSRHRRVLDRERRIAAALPGGIAELRIRDRGDAVQITFASPGLPIALGGPGPSAVDRLAGAFDLLESVDRQDRTRLLEALRTPPGDGRLSIEFRGRSRSGPGEHWFELDAIGRRCRGSIVWNAFICEVTERRRAAREAARLAAIVEHSDEAILSFDLAGRIVSWNPAAEQILGIPAEDALGLEASAVVPPERVEEHRQIFDRTLEGCRTLRIETTRLAADGERRSVISAMSPLRDGSGSVVGVSEILTDITRRKQVESQLAESLRVVDDVSHEFRTPLAVIREFASIIADGIAGPTTEAQAEYLSIIDGAVADLNHMVEDLLDSSRLRAGSLRVERRAIEVPDMFAAMRRGLATKARLRRIEIREAISPDLPTVFADEGKARRVLSNLMTNAIKFSPDGGVVTIAAQPGPGLDEVSISVRDEGPGLSEEEIARLFGRFEQMAAARRSTAKGFGLGLSIARELAWLNLGELSVRSRKGEGATFSFTLPTAGRRAVLEHAATTIHALAADTDPIAMLLAEPASADRAAGDLLHAWMCSCSYATDLVLPAGCCGDAELGVHVFGRTRAPQAWLDRLRRLHAACSAEDPESVPPAEFSIAGVWPPGVEPETWIACSDPSEIPS